MGIRYIETKMDWASSSVLNRIDYNSSEDCVIYWIIAGQFVNVYYLIKNGEEYSKQIREGKLKSTQVMLGVFLTMFLWPVTIYNQEIRQKRK